MGVTNVVLAPRDLERGAAGGNVLLFHNNIYPYPALKLSAGDTGVTGDTGDKEPRRQGTKRATVGRICLRRAPSACGKVVVYLSTSVCSVEVIEVPAATAATEVV